MLKKNIYVRCPVESEEERFSRYFCMGRIVEINDATERVLIEFYDPENIGAYYDKPLNTEYSFNQVKHEKIHEGSLVIYNGDYVTVLAEVLNKIDGYYYYYLRNKQDEVIYACETDIIAGYNCGVVSPMEQLVTYEFQNPAWYLGRCNVSRTMQIIENSLYGFKDLAGCKIYLKAYQLKTVMRCLQQSKCRFMIADEVGLGKTIEAISVLKVYLNGQHNKHVLFVVPQTLVEQWKTELAFKFELFDGRNENGNYITIISTEQILSINAEYDFIIVDEVHRFLKNKTIYDALLNLSRHAQNIIMLSATPMQSRQEEYKKLLTLIQPEKYENVSQEEFNTLLELQNSVVRKVYDSLNGIESLNEEIKAADGEHTEDTEMVFEDIIDSLSKIKTLIGNETFNRICDGICYEDDDFGLSQMQTALAYVCENYQLEKSIIRNRRIGTTEIKANIRRIVDLSYDLHIDNSNSEYNAYRLLCDWIESVELNPDLYATKFKNIVESFFSSAHAFVGELKAFGKTGVPNELLNYALKWEREEDKVISNINKIFEEPDIYANRIVRLIDYVDQECEDKKVLIFTHYRATFDLYKEIIISYFGSENCCFFCDGMSNDELELNAYRFQNDKQKYRILLSDETGGEGRNFQNADLVIHIDIPWEANALEQRIGRLDRIGRKEENPVISVVSYAKETIEEDLFKLWNFGVSIFTKAQSGLEIIMNDINEKIVDTICDDFKYGLSNIIPEMVKLIEKQTAIVNKERYFDIAAIQYDIINKTLMHSIEELDKNETEYFAAAMMSWASLSGFHADSDSQSRIIFSSDSLSYNSAKNSLFVPPDMKSIIEDRLNQIRNRVRVLNGEKELKANIGYIKGTFDRPTAISNDYLHFYAPGDKIFDSIVNNAIYSYKGTCSAFEGPASIDWDGFVFVWSVKLDEALICEKHINRYAINQYRGFLPSEQIITVVPAVERGVNDKEVIREYVKIITNNKDYKKQVKNYGERHGKSENITKFIKKFVPEKWKRGAKKAYTFAYKKAQRDINDKMKGQLEALKHELISRGGAQKAAAIYFNSKPEETIEEIERQNEEIYKIIEAYQLVLDSVCYIRMKKNDEQ